MKGQQYENLEYVWELVGDVHGHGAHPEEKADESVLSAEAKKDAKSIHRF